MGTKCAPSYAILFMGKLEENFLRTQRFQPHIWWRYIDDIFMIWPHGPEKLDAFILGLNNYHPSIKFTVTSSPETADFLDVTIKKDAIGRLHSTLYTKPTDAHLYLHYNSYHPKHQKKSIPYSQAIRLRRICSSIKEFNKCAEKLKSNLLARNYPTDIINKAITKARNRTREDLLNPSPDKPAKTVIPLILQYHPHNPTAKEILLRHHHILTRDPNLSIFKEYKPLTVYRRSPNIRQMLVRSNTITPTARPGSKPCGKPCIL